VFGKYRTVTQMEKIEVQSELSKGNDYGKCRCDYPGPTTAATQLVDAHKMPVRTWVLCPK
jgi:hypothetical protein